MVICYIIGCKSRTETKSQDITFHTFPKDSATRQLWIRATGRPNWQPTKYTRISSRHFEQSCFRKTARNITYLKPFSIPTLHIVEQVPMEILSTSIELPVDIPSTSHHIPMQIDSIPTQDDFYTYASIEDLISICAMDKEKITKIRSIGILESVNGRFFLKDIHNVNKNDAANILVSMSYIKSSLPSSVIPYTVQIFGTMQWKKRPVIFAKILQVLNTTSAIQLSNAMQSICCRHLATQ